MHLLCINYGVYGHRNEMYAKRTEVHLQEGNANGEGNRTREFGRNQREGDDD